MLHYIYEEIIGGTIYMGKLDIDSLTIVEVRKRARDFQIGDHVAVKNKDGQKVVAVLERFYPNLVQYRDEKGRVFTLDYLAASKAKLIQPSDFEIHSESMDRDALLDGLGKRKVGDGNEDL